MPDSDYQFIHAERWDNRKTYKSGLIVTMKHLETGELTLKYIDNPKQLIGVTKPERRSLQNVKLSADLLENLNIVAVSRSRMRSTLQRMLLPKVESKLNLTTLINMPYVYGADIQPDAIEKQRMYLASGKRLSKKYRVGSLDIETDMLGEVIGPNATRNDIIIMTYTTPELHTYITIVRRFVKGFTYNNIEAAVKKSRAEFISKLNDKALAVLKGRPLSYSITVCETELEVIKHTFDMIHETKPDHVCIWNMIFDIPRIIARLVALGVDPASVMCHPEVPVAKRTCVFESDDRPGGQKHLTWDTARISGYTQYYDGMRLLARLRKYDGTLDSYGLDALAKSTLGVGKDNHNGLGHPAMQRFHQMEYCAYAGVDTIAPTLMDMVNQDILSMHGLIPYTPIGTFAQQNQQLKNRWSAYCTTIGKMSGAIRGGVKHPTDKEISNQGGNVIPPGLAWRTMVQRVKEVVNFPKQVLSKIILMGKDSDVLSEYPSITQAANFSKETKILTILEIVGFPRSYIYEFSSLLLTPRENAVFICSKYFGLPGFDEMSKLYDEQTKTGETQCQKLNEVN